MKRDLLSIKDTAEIFQVNPNLIHRLFTCIKKDEDYMKKRLRKNMIKNDMNRAVESSIRNQIEVVGDIKSAAQIVQDLALTRSIKVSKTRVCKVLKKEMEMHYCKIKYLPINANSEKSLVLR